MTPTALLIVFALSVAEHAPSPSSPKVPPPADTEAYINQSAALDLITRMSTKADCVADVDAKTGDILAVTCLPPPRQGS